MTTIQTAAGEQDLFAALNGIPRVDLPANLQAALEGGNLLSFFHGVAFPVDSTPRAYRLKVGNADLPISTSSGAIP